MPRKKLEYPDVKDVPSDGDKDEDEEMEGPRLLRSPLCSPMANLSGDLSRLSTHTRGQTPKCRLSLDDVDTPPSDQSSDASASLPSSSTLPGVFLDSPTPIDSPTFDRPRRLRKIKSASSVARPGTSAEGETSHSAGRCVVRRVSADGGGRGQERMEEGDSNSGDSLSMLQDFVNDNSNSDSGISLEKKRVQEPGFKVPPPVTRWRSKLNEISEDACSPHKYSPAKSFKRSLSFSPLGSQQHNTDGKTPVQIKRSSSMRTTRSSDPLHGLDSPQRSDRPKGMEVLLGEPVIQQPNTPDTTGTPSTPVSCTTGPNNPPDCLMSESDNNTPVRPFLHARRHMMLRSHSVDVRSPSSPSQLPSPTQNTSPASLHRSRSASEAVIKEAVHKMTEEPNLIADSTKPCLLPTIPGKHQDLKTITHQSLVAVLEGRYASEVEQYHIIDCRYPYEYDGGHIQGAVNIYKRNMLIEKYLQNPMKKQDPNKRFMIIFHCEFSSERGPDLYRYLRKVDRQLNSNHYPRLYYPEMYLLEGGYSAFYVFHKRLCEPQTYIPMLHKDYASQLLLYQGDKKKGGRKKGVGGSAARPLTRSSSASRSLDLC